MKRIDGAPRPSDVYHRHRHGVNLYVAGLGITFIIVEHNVKALMDLTDRIEVLNFGKKIAEGTPMEISKQEGIIQAYLAR